MTTLKQEKVLKKIATLRERRLQLADLEMSRANAAVDDATQKLLDADEMLSRTDVFCRQEHRRLNEELSQGSAMGKEGLFAWRKAHEKLEDRLTAVKNRQADARSALEAEHIKRDEVKAKRRAEALAVERLKVMQTPDKRGN